MKNNNIFLYKFHTFLSLLNIKMNYDRAIKESQQLIDENETLRNRLRDVVNSPLSDAEKQQIIDDSQRLHSSAPASIALPNVNEIFPFAYF